MINVSLCFISKCYGFPAFGHTNGSLLTPTYLMLRKVYPGGMNKEAEVMQKAFLMCGKEKVTLGLGTIRCKVTLG